MLRGLHKRWRLASEPNEDQVAALVRHLRIDPLVGRLLVSRGLDDPQIARTFLDPKLTDLHDPTLLPGCTAAADRIIHALRHDEPIVIYGDYDVDGVTATAILYHMLTTAKPDADVRRFIPHRIDDGYGLNADALKQLADDGAKLIISVDCGITASEPAAAIRDRAVDLIITDHHAMSHDPTGPVVPTCFTCVHPALPGSAYPFPDLCGAGVAYKLAWEIARRWCGSERVSHVFRDQLLNLLALAALGTVADVVPLLGENRAIVRHGLARIKHTRFDGLNALIDASRLRDEKIDAFHVGFVLGPRLNACGRLGHARDACDLLTEATGTRAGDLAAHLNQVNDQRRAAERGIVDQARQMIEADGDIEQHRAFVLASDQWHPGVVGIVCSRLVDQFGRPCVLLHTDGQVAKGSARSIDGFNLHEAVTACGEYLVTYGGHAMAAGMTLQADRIDAFRQAFCDHAAARLSADDLTPIVDLDLACGLETVTATAAGQLRQLAPFGRANPEPHLLLRNVRIAADPRIMGKQSQHLAFGVAGGGGTGGQTVRCVWWQQAAMRREIVRGRIVDLAVKPKLNQWRGRSNLELEVLDLRIPSDAETR